MNYGSAKFSVSIAAGGMTTAAQLADIVRSAIASNGWGVANVEAVSAGAFSNFFNVTITINSLCGDDFRRIANGIAASLAPRYGGLTVRHIATTGCNAATVAAQTPTIPAGYVYQGGNLATVTVRGSDTPDAPASTGMIDTAIDTIKGIDTTTLVIAAVAAVLLLKR